ncbi:MAG: glycerophosphodiester phosphodiesterase [Balneolaceae bacterium]|nr:glycerophosphodiester phosphodiesterase [Balneolaceae bacterium]
MMSHKKLSQAESVKFGLKNYTNLISNQIRSLVVTNRFSLKFCPLCMIIPLIIALESLSAQNCNTDKLSLPEFIAHRGASWLAPENTMAAFQLAWEMDVDAVELDVFLTKDGEVVVFHDPNTKRITGHDGNIEEMTLDELRELDFGSWKSSQWEGESIPTLYEALSTLPKGKRIFVDVKSDTSIVRPMLDVFDKIEHFPHQIVVIAFSYELAAKTKKLRPRTPVYWLVGFGYNSEDDQWNPSMDDIIERALKANLDGVNLHFAGPARWEESVHKIREAGLGYYVWTVNNIEDAQKAIELGVDGITTDRPAWLKKQLLSKNGWRLLRKN